MEIIKCDDFFHAYECPHFFFLPLSLAWLNLHLPSSVLRLYGGMRVSLCCLDLEIYSLRNKVDATISTPQFCNKGNSLPTSFTTQRCV